MGIKKSEPRSADLKIGILGGPVTGKSCLVSRLVERAKVQEGLLECACRIVENYDENGNLLGYCCEGGDFSKLLVHSPTIFESSTVHLDTNQIVILI